MTVLPVSARLTAARGWLPRSVPGWTMAGFGAMALLFGAVGLARPEAVLSILGFPVLDPAERVAGDHTAVFVAASSMASFNMGVYYLLAAATEWRPFYRFTVAFRMVTLVVFSTLVIIEAAPARFLGVALWEGAGALVTGLALAYERRRSVAGH